ncbi:hypothetical protein D3C86_1951320 [compost metagenome]
MRKTDTTQAMITLLWTNGCSAAGSLASRDGMITGISAQPSVMATTLRLAGLRS